MKRNRIEESLPQRFKSFTTTEKNRRSAPGQERKQGSYPIKSCGCFLFEYAKMKHVQRSRGSTFWVGFTFVNASVNCQDDVIYLKAVEEGYGWCG
jgi:hypothetical protein